MFLKVVVGHSKVKVTAKAKATAKVMVKTTVEVTVKVTAKATAKVKHKAQVEEKTTLMRSRAALPRRRAGWRAVGGREEDNRRGPGTPAMARPASFPATHR